MSMATQENDMEHQWTLECLVCVVMKLYALFEASEALKKMVSQVRLVAQWPPGLDTLW